MDRCSRIVISLALSLILSVEAKGFDTNDNIRLPIELGWIAQSADRVRAITQRPRECLSPPITEQVQLGRLAFESPALLGGQAARMGLSCASCHPAARANKHFFVENISSEPGTADVTHSFFSSKGGNRDFKPTKIPDLANLKTMTLPYRNQQAFRDKLQQLIEVEFDGQPTHPTIFNALQIYLQNTGSQFCAKSSAYEAITLGYDWQRLMQSVMLLERAIKINDQALIDFVVRATRLQLENIYRRYGIAKDESVDAALIESSRKLQSIVTLEHRSARLNVVAVWRKHAQTLYGRLSKLEKFSAYDPQALTKKLTSLSNN